MNPRQLSRAELITFARAAASAVASGKVTGLTDAQRTAISTALSDGADRLTAADVKAVNAKTVYHESVRAAQGIEGEVNDILTDLKFAMRGARSPGDEYKAVGFAPPAQAGKLFDPERPSDLSAVGYSNGVNLLRYKGNNVPGRVSYVIAARPSRDADYVIIGQTRKQSFKHTPVVPGQFYEYRVRAEASRGRVSDWSNETVVYPPS